MSAKPLQQPYGRTSYSVGFKPVTNCVPQDVVYYYEGTPDSINASQLRELIRRVFGRKLGSERLRGFDTLSRRLIPRLFDIFQ